MRLGSPSFFSLSSLSLLTASLLPSAILHSQDAVQAELGLDLRQPVLAPVAVDRGLENDRAESKIEPALMRDALQLKERGLVLSGGVAKNHVRVVIELRRQRGDVNFDDCTARDAVGAVAAATRRRQDAFERSLLVAPLGVGQQVRLIDRISLQYSVVARVFSHRALLTLAGRADVKYVWKDHLNKLFTNEGRALTGSTAAHNSGHRGSGVGVAVIDTKYDLLHPELGASTSLPNSIVKGGVNFSDTGQTIHSRSSSDAYHGTGTAAIVRRYAQQSDLYCLVVFPNAFDSVIANAINWCVTNRNGTGGGAPIKVISMSLGGGRHYSAQTSGTMHTACGNARSNGIIVFAASGNDGWTNSMGSPAASTNCISVGSVWDANNAGYSPFPPAYCSDSNRLVNERCCYSDTASFLDMYMPSEQVITARPGGGTSALGGTSSACPAAAGITAQFLSARASYAGNQSGIVSLYQQTGVSVIGDTSKRRVNITAALNQTGGGGGGSTALQKGATQNYSISTGSTKRWTIAVPAGATNLSVTLTGSGDADLYVKNASVSWPGDQGRHDTATFKAPYIGGSNESVTFASPSAGTWHVLVHGYSGNPTGTIVADWTVSSGGSPKWNYENWAQNTPHNYANSRTYTYTYRNPGSQRVAVHFNRLDTETNYDFVRIKDANGTTRYTVSGNLINNGSGNAFGRSDGWVIVDGDTLTIELRTDGSVTDWGLRTDRAAGYK